MQLSMQESEERFRSLAGLSSDWYWEQDEQLRISYVSPGFEELAGATPGEVLGRKRWGSDTTPLNFNLEEYRDGLQARRPFRDLELLRVGEGGARHYLAISGGPVFDSKGEFRGYRGVGKDITSRKQTEAMLQGQKQVLEMIARGAPLKEILTALMHVVEAQSPGMLCSVLLLDPDGLHLRHGAAPSLPEDYARAIDGVAIGASVGSCGTAAFRRAQFVVEDIAIDPLWSDFRELALGHGLRACWSTPIFDTRQRVLGTFAMYYRQPGAPTERHQWLVDTATQLAAVAISHHAAEAAPRIDVGFDGAERAYFVRNNGVGFDMRHAGKLFHAFERLHGESEFEGTGIGLALVQRIVQRYDGRAWARSAPDQGATFWLTVPGETFNSTRA